jgi:chromosome segregation ATPase
MRVEITSQHSHALGVERTRSSELEENVQAERTKYHQLADDLRRKEEKNKLDQNIIQDERQKSTKLSMQLNTLINLRDDLRSQISDLQVQLSTTEQSAKSTTGTLETKNQEYLTLRKELEELKVNIVVLKQRKVEENMKTTSSSSKNEDARHMKEASPMSLSSLSSPSSSTSSHAASAELKHQLRATLTECSALRTEIQTLRMTIHEKDFRLSALREIVGGLERMVPPERLL